MAFFKKNLNLFILLILGIVAFLRATINLDPDFGWHLRMGELIIQKGIPLTDPFSYTMPSYNFIDHEWLSNVLIAIGYKSIGIYGLALIFALIFVAAIFIAIPKKFKEYASLPLALAGALMLGFFGIRTQVITWFFLALLLRVIFDEDLWKKWKFFVPLLFIPWVNLHGGFAAGIVILSLVFLFKSIQNKRFEIIYFVISILSLALTFVNPYGPRIWWEIWMQTSDSSLHWNIAEWVPAVFYFDFALLILFTLSLFLVYKYRAKIKGLKILIYLFLLATAISSIRNLPLWGLSAILITSAAIKFLIDEVKKTKYGLLRLKKIKKILFLFILLVLAYEIYGSLNSANSLSEQNFYPVQAVNFLSHYKMNGNLFTSYNYAGYVLWKVPAKKDFIDGRMPSWRRNGVYPNESNYAFKDYLKMISDDSFFKQMIKKYDIRYVLLPTPPVSKNKPAPTLAKIDNYLRKFEFWRTNSQVLDEDLTKLGMKKIYNDGKFVIYQK
jgi:hypothetical protein